MNQEELVRLQKKLKESMLSTWALFLEVDKIINSSLQDKTPKVITNEDVEEICGYSTYETFGCAFDDNRSCAGCKYAIKSATSVPSKGHL